jgi:hypothetical protein
MRFISLADVDTVHKDNITRRRCRTLLDIGVDERVHGFDSFPDISELEQLEQLREAGMERHSSQMEDSINVSKDHILNRCDHILNQCRVFANDESFSKLPRPIMVIPKEDQVSSLCLRGCQLLPPYLSSCHPVRTANWWTWENGATTMRWSVTWPHLQL